MVGIHVALGSPADAMAAEYGVLALQEVVRAYFDTPSSPARDAPLARRLRRMLDETG